MSRNQSFFRSSGLAVVLVALAASPASADDARIEALYPMSAPSNATFAGVELDRLAIPGLHLRARDDHAADRGGTTLSLADDHGDVRAVVRLCVARDSATARVFLREVLTGIAGRLAPSTIDEVAFADEAGKGDHLVVAARGNVAYSISVSGGGPSAASIAEHIKRTFVSGAPKFPSARITLAETIAVGGAPVSVVVPPGASYRVHASGAYIARSKGRGAKDPLTVRPFGPGRVEVTAIVSDALARVTETTAAATAH